MNITSGDLTNIGIVLSGVLLVCTIGSLLYHKREGTAAKKLPTIIIAMYILWVIGPPCWFMFEYWMNETGYLKGETAKLARLKDYQDLAGKIWAAIIVVFGLLIVHKYKLKIGD